MTRRTIGILVGTLVLLGFYNMSEHTHAEATLTIADRIAYTVCHRLPTHSLTIFGERVLPLCARCSGIYLGIVWGSVYLAATRRLRHALFPNRWLLILLLGLVGIMGLDGFNSLFFDIGSFHLYHPRNWLRLVTGIGTGIAVSLIIMPTFASTAWREPIWEPPIDNRQDGLILAVGAALIVAVLLLEIPFVVYVLAMLSAGGVVLILALLYSTMVMVATRRNGREQPVPLIIPLAVGLLFGLLQMTVIAWMRFNLTGTWSGF